MPLSINIFDIQDLNANTILEVGQRATINLKWSGSDQKLEHILGSSMRFDIIDQTFQDGTYAHLSTSDERRYRVTLVDEADGSTLWRGHLLPDLYSEPYRVGSFPVSFTASCGLGTLKNQYLDADFYQAELSLVEILSAILKLTGHSLDFWIDPAIVNSAQPFWHQNYLDDALFTDDDAQDDAYEILEKIVEGSLCRIYQLDDRWYIEGVNKLGRYERIFQRYDADGNYLGEGSQQKSAINRTFYADPEIVNHIPVKVIEGYYELDDSNIAESAFKVSNPGFVVTTDVELVNYDWVYTSVGFTPKYNTKDGKVFFAPLGNSNESIRLRSESLLSAGDRVEWIIEMTNYWDGTGTFGRDVEEIVLSGDWDKSQPYEIYYTNPSNGQEVILYSNINGSSPDDARYQLLFDTDRKARLSIKMIAPVTAYYNIRFYQPTAPSGTKLTGIFLDGLYLNNISEDGEQVYTDTIEGTYTRDLERELPMHDDMRKLVHMIRLSRLKDQGTTYDTLTANNLVTLNVDGKNYIRLSLEFLTAALAHKDSITVEGTDLTVVGALYNYLGSQEHYLEYDSASYGGLVSDGDAMILTLKTFAPVPSNITDWQQWYDDFYGISPVRYGQAYVDVLRKLYVAAHPMIEATVRGFVTPQDILGFNYRGQRAFYVLDCEQHLDRFQTTLILSENFYGEAATELLPPVVDAGVDIALASGESTTTLTAVASDPDGTIVSVLWEVVSGSGAVITTDDQLITEVTGLTSASYEFKVTVTDNDGLTAFDTVRVSKSRGYTLEMTLVVDTEKSTNPGNQDPFEALDREWYEMRVVPELDEDQTARVVIDGVIIKQTPVDIAGAKPSAVFSLGYNNQFFEAGVHQIVTLFRRGDVKTLALQAKAFNSVNDSIFPNVDGNVYAKVQADIPLAEIVTGSPGTFTNLPLQYIVEARK